LTVVDFYLGLGSRYSYLAASQVDRLEAQYGCRFVWKPIASGALIDRRGDNPFRREDGTGQYDRAYREYDAKAWAAHYGIPFQEPAPFEVDASVPALACLAAEAQGALVPCCRRLFELIFAEGAVIDDAAIDALPVRLRLDPAAFRHDLGSDAVRMRHEALIDEAQTRGAFGVPTFCFDGRLFWGNDRLPLLEAALRGVALPRWPHRTDPKA
jgi:2-hydroxychromene-2-carboxylate isomerase